MLLVSFKPRFTSLSVLLVNYNYGQPYPLWRPPSGNQSIKFAAYPRRFDPLQDFYSLLEPAEAGNSYLSCWWLSCDDKRRRSQTSTV